MLSFPYEMSYNKIVLILIQSYCRKETGPRDGYSLVLSLQGKMEAHQFDIAYNQNLRAYESRVFGCAVCVGMAL